MPSRSPVAAPESPAAIPRAFRGLPCTVVTMPEEFDTSAMIERFRARATAVKSRGVPPIEGPDRQRFIEQARLDFMDYAMLGDAEASIEDGILTLRVDLRPQKDEGSDRSSGD